MIDIKEIEDKYIANIYHKRPIAINKGKGIKLWDIDGKEYLDCMGGWGVSSVGHSHPDLVQAITNQAQTLITCTGTLYNPVRAKLGEKLCSISPKGLNQVFFTNSGAEAIECAIKLARKYTGKSEIIAFKKAFHGRTFGALSATWKPKYKKPFEPLVPGFKHVGQNIDEISQNIGPNTAAILIEPIQGEGGVILPKIDFINSLQELCKKNNILIIADEVQAGMARTGKMFSSEHFNLFPDIMCVAKGLAGGFPIGATLAKNEIWESLNKGEHGSTFGGNPLACAAGIATINIIEKEKIVDNVKIKGNYFLEGLKKLQTKYNSIREIRGVGLMIAMEFRFPTKDIILNAVEKGLLVLPTGLNVIRFLPPLTITEKEIDQVLNILDTVLHDLEQ